MSELSLEIKGLKETQKAAEDVAREISRSGNLVAKAALVVERQAKMNATGRPGPKVQTDRLRSSITIKIKSPTEATVGTVVEYAAPVEYGHATRGRLKSLGIQFSTGGFSKSGISATGLGRVPAYPFLGPTIEQTRGQIGEVMVAFGNDLGAIWNK